jgi:hypothetical protein
MCNCQTVDRLTAYRFCELCITRILYIHRESVPYTMYEFELTTINLAVIHEFTNPEWR